MDSEKRIPLIGLGVLIAGLLLFVAVNALLGGSGGDEGGQASNQSVNQGESAPDIGSPGDSQPVSAGQPDPPVTLMRVLYNYDITDPAELVERSEEVVVAEVTAKTGSEPMQSSIPGDSEPRGQYEVRVIEGIRGGSSEGDTLQIEQRGGNAADGDPVVVEAESTESGISPEEARGQLLQEGSTYLFALSEEGTAAAPYLVLAQPTGNVLLTDNAESEQVVQSFRDAAESG